MSGASEMKIFRRKEERGLGIRDGAGRPAVTGSKRGEEAKVRGKNRAFSRTPGRDDSCETGKWERGFYRGAGRRTFSSWRVNFSPITRVRGKFTGFLYRLGMRRGGKRRVRSSSTTKHGGQLSARVRSKMISGT